MYQQYNSVTFFLQDAYYESNAAVWNCLMPLQRNVAGFLAGREGDHVWIRIEWKIMNIIAAVDKNWAIGKNNELLVRIPMDQKFFRETTTGKVVVMGRKTLESFPNGLPLKNRTNIVLTHNPAYQVKDAIVVHSMEELHRELEKYDTNDVYVIGGQKIYEQLLDECDVAHITKIDYAYDADAYFPNLDEKPEWKITADSEEQTYFDLEFYFYKYERVQK
jgi:dihydrofolate reductase